MVIVRSDREADDSLVNLGVITDSFFDNESLKDPEKPLVIGRLLVPSVRRRNLGDQPKKSRRSDVRGISSQS
jgi:hypothetical protein